MAEKSYDAEILEFPKPDGFLKRWIKIHGVSMRSICSIFGITRAVVLMYGEHEIDRDKMLKLKKYIRAPGKIDMERNVYYFSAGTLRERQLRKRP